MIRKRENIEKEPRHVLVGIPGAAFYFGVFLFVFLLAVNGAAAQETLPDVDLAPPPLAVISKNERSMLDRTTEIKDRTKLAAEMMDARMDMAEKLNAGGDYEAMFGELGAFQGLVANTLEFLNRRNTGSDKSLDGFKRFEITLRAFMPRLEGIRRELPTRYEEFVRKLLRYLREARASAVDPLFSDTVVPTRRPSNEN